MYCPVPAYSNPASISINCAGQRSSRQQDVALANLAKGDNPHGARLAGGLPEIELALRLEVRPSVGRACGSLHRDPQVISFCDGQRLLGGLGLRGREVIGSRGGGYREGDSACDQRGGSHSDDRFADDWIEHFVPYSSFGRTCKQRADGLNVPVFEKYFQINKFLVLAEYQYLRQ
jgi:hypothetical protein